MNTTTVSGSAKPKPKSMMKKPRKKKSKIYFGTHPMIMPLGIRYTPKKYMLLS